MGVISVMERVGRVRFKVVMDRKREGVRKRRK